MQQNQGLNNLNATITEIRNRLNAQNQMHEVYFNDFANLIISYFTINQNNLNIQECINRLLIVLETSTIKYSQIVNLPIRVPTHRAYRFHMLKCFQNNNICICPPLIWEDLAHFNHLNEEFNNNQNGGEYSNKNKLKKTKQKITINKIKYTIYIGPRGGKYINKNNKFMLLKKIK